MKTTHNYEVTEFKDKNKKNRIRTKASNGNITHSSTQGYFNLKDCKHTTICSSIAIVGHYKGELDEDQIQDLRDILNSVETNK